MTRQGRSSPSCQRGSRTALRRSPGVSRQPPARVGRGGRIARRLTPDLVTTSRFSAIRPEVHGVSAEEQASLDGYSAFSPPLERGTCWLMGRLEAEEVESLRSDNDGRARRGHVVPGIGPTAPEETTAHSQSRPHHPGDVLRWGLLPRDREHRDRLLLRDRDRAQRPRSRRARSHFGGGSTRETPASWQNPAYAASGEVSTREPP
jgi:hypothetical protein